MIRMNSCGLYPAGGAGSVVSTFRSGRKIPFSHSYIALHLQGLADRTQLVTDAGECDFQRSLRIYPLGACSRRPVSAHMRVEIVADLVELSDADDRLGRARTSCRRLDLHG